MPSFAANVLPEALKAFRDRYAGVNVTVHDVINEQVIEMVREGRVEMGIAFEPSPNHNLLFTPLAVDRFVAIVPQQSPLAKKKQLSWQELLTLDFITLQRPSAVRLMLEEALARSGRQLDVALESHQLVTVGRMVASGLGGSAVPALCKTQMASLGAVCIPLSDPPIEKCVGAIHAGHLPLSKAAQALLDTLDSTTHVADVVTAPVMTPLLTFAAARGCKVQTGPEMALAQMRLMGQFIGAIPQAQGAAA